MQVRYLAIPNEFPSGGTMQHPKSRSFKHPLVSVPLTLLNANTQKREPLGPIRRIVFHWSAGSWISPWDDYHANIIWDPNANKPFVVQALLPTQKGQHLYQRNTGSYGIGFCASGPGAVAREMVEMGALLAAELCRKYGLDPNGVQADGVPVVCDHAMYAKLDHYYPERWDVGSQETDSRNLMKPIAAKTPWYYSKMRKDTLGHWIYEFGKVI